MSIAGANALLPIPPQPTVLPGQVQLAQGGTVPVPVTAVTANDKGANAGQAKNDTGSKPELDDRRRGRLVDRYA
jgi:hypothetical protein